jgi:hypothetical protein
MTRWLRWLVALTILTTMAWGGYWAVAIYALSRSQTDCSNDVLQEAMSSDGKQIATAFERNCGATTPFVRIVSVRPGGSRFDSENTDEWVFTVEGQPDIQLTWTAPERLTVKYGGGSRVFRKAVVWYGLVITYE